MSDTTRLKLPLIAAQQAQKHVTHNESLLKLDVLVQARVLDRDLNTPPANPAEGDAYIVAVSATGDWAGQEGNIAAWQNGGWVFHAPSEGWKVWVADEDTLYVHDGTAWLKFETGIATVNPVPDGKLGINTTADNTNRLAVKSDAVLFSHDDVSGSGSGNVQFKINKAAATNTASLLFQDNWSGRAELGLTGDDDFHIKASADGNAWHEAMVVDSTSGWVRFPSGGVRELLRAHRTFYVNPAGNDGADGLSPDTALRTVQEAVRRCYMIDSNGFNVTIRLAPGIYEGNVVIDRRIVGGARLDIVGNATDPSSVILRNNVNYHTIRIIDCAKVGIYDLQIENTSNWSLIFVDTGADLKYGNVVFTQCNRDHVEASANALVLVADDYTITGGGRSHMNFSKGCIFQASNRVVTLRNTPHFLVAFAWFQRGSHYSVWNMTWSGAATGRRYYVRSNATCNGEAPDHFPGDVDGIADTGGYYGGA